MSKPDVCESLLVAIKDQHGMKDYVIPIAGLHVQETEDGECRIMIETNELKAEGPCNVLAVATDDPTTKQAYGYRSLGHTWLRLGLIGCRMEQYPGMAVFTSQIQHFESELGVPER